MTIEFDSTGIISQNLTEIIDERESALKVFLGQDFVVSGDSIVGNLQLSDADRELAIQELIVYLAVQMNPDTAEGIFLDFICALNNIYRLAPQYTTIPITVTGTVGIAVDAGNLTIVDETTDEYYANQSAFTIGSGGTVDVVFQATSYGTILASNSSTYSIKTPLSGITSTAYTIGGTTSVGSYVETDSELRARREYLLDLAATSTKASIKSAVLEVDGVDFCQVYENDTSGTVDGIPSKAFEVVVRGGTDEDIATAILSKKPTGIQAYGSETVVVTDEYGDEFTIGFTRATEVPLEARLTLLVSSTQTSDWEDTVKQALVDKFTQLYTVGQDVFVYNLYCVLNSYLEIINTSVFQIQKEIDSASWSSTVDILPREVGTLDVANIAITQVTP